MKSRLDFLGRWPFSGEKARKEKRMIHITREKRLYLIHGEKEHVLVSFFVSNDMVHMGEITIPVKGYSEIEVHKGDEAIYILDGTLTIMTYEDEDTGESISQGSYEVRKEEKFLVPEGVRHQYLNFTDQLVKIIFAIAPQL